jgi:hypothetical protein
VALQMDFSSILLMGFEWCFPVFIIFLLHAWYPRLVVDWDRGSKTQMAFWFLGFFIFLSSPRKSWQVSRKHVVPHAASSGDS